MNPPPPPLQPPRSSFSCDRHPDETFTGFCPSCLCERLHTLDQSANATSASSSSRRNSTSSAIKSLFRSFETNNNNNNNSNDNSRNKTATLARNSSFLPELRRSKSFSASKNESISFYEPQRKSCDVRGRNTLWSLFSIDDEDKRSHSYVKQQTNLNLGHNAVVLETDRENENEDDDEGNEIQEEEEEDDDRIHKVDEEVVEEEEEEEEEIIAFKEVTDIVNDLNNDIVEEAVEIEETVDQKRKKSITEELKPMKENIHIDLEDTEAKKPSSSRSNFYLWSAASVLTKKWHKWRRKQKERVTRTNGVVLSSALPVEKPISRQFRETQSEIADYGFGRRSCDTEPRFSLDVGRISFDDPRYSFDEPRASWDGYLIGRTFPRLPPMVEDAPVVHVPRCDSQIPVENEDNSIPGGSVQTREYYLDSSSKRRKSLDRSNSIRRMAAAVVAELDETKMNVNPAIDPPRVSNYSNSNSLRDDSSETFELGFRDRENGIPVQTKEVKKPRKWRWKLWGFGFGSIHRRSKDEDEDRCNNVSGVGSVGRSYAESWQDIRDCSNEVNQVSRKVFRSNSSVSWRSSSFRKSNPNPNPNGSKPNGRSRRTGDEFVIERNRSARYSPNHIDNGLLRFYLAPLSGSRRSGIGCSRPNGSAHSIARSMFRLY